MVKTPKYSWHTYESRSLPAVPWLNVHRGFEQVVGKLLLAHVAHRVQVLEEPLRDRRHVAFRTCNIPQAVRWLVCAHPDVVLHLQTVRLVLILLDFACDFSHFPPLAEVDQLLAVAFEEVWITFLCLQDVGQINT